MKNNLCSIILYLDDIDNYVNSILNYHFCNEDEKNKLDINEILMYLSSVSEIIQEVKNYIYSISCQKN